MVSCLRINLGGGEGGGSMGIGLGGGGESLKIALGQLEDNYLWHSHSWKNS
jgi:hypothetical protein